MKLISRKLAPASVLLLLCSTQAIHAQFSSGSTGPVITEYGRVFEIPDPGLEVSPEMVYRVLFDVADSPADVGEVNRSIETLARFLNMHARAGVPPENMHLALVLHGRAAKDALNDAAYRRRHEMSNPNRPLLKALAGVGARIYICGQSATGQGIGREELDPTVKMALSAMTALVTLQEEGYQLIPW